MIVAIQSDDFPWPRGAQPDASSPHWAAYIESAGHSVRWVDVYRPDILEQLDGCSGFMWRFAHVTDMRQIASRLLPVIERELGLAVYPDQNTCWHYDDKIAQAYLLRAHQIPIPDTWIFYRREDALQWCQQEATYPLVTKLWSGAGSVNVRQVTNAAEAAHQIETLFDRATFAWEDDAPPTVRGRLKRVLRNLQSKVNPGTTLQVPGTYWDLHHNYVLFQQWLPDNPFDTRVTVIGNGAFAFRRFNRENDFRASGSGKLDWDSSAIDPPSLRLAFATARAVDAQSCAIDVLQRDGRPVVCEISYTYSSAAVYRCPGHWELRDDDTHSGKLHWVSGCMRPEEAQVSDFIARIEANE